MLKTFLFSGVVLISAFALVTGSTGCANIVPPQGGPRDTIPPVLLKVNPGDSTTGFTGSKIVFNFDEFVEVQNIQEQLLVSPLAKITPVVDYKLREVTVKLKDTLEPNTTYTLDFGKSVKDITEGNFIKDLRYIFSTGNYIDSLELEGQVLIAETAKPDSTLIVMLYTSQEDSVVIREKPKYITRLDNKGYFHFRNLPPNQYYIYALKDETGTRRYMSDKQLFAFADTVVNPALNKTAPTLYAWAKKETPLSASPEPVSGGSRNKPATGADKRLKFQLNLANNQQDLLGDLVMSFESPLKNFDSTGFRLYTDSSFIPAPAYQLSKDSTGLKITVKTTWLENTRYQLILDKTFAEDSSGRQLLKSDTLSFTTKRKADYGTLKIRFRKLEPERKPVLQLLLAQQAPVNYPLTTAEFNLPLLNPGEYELRIFYDDNGNGSWDTGEFFKNRRQPEQVIPIGRKLTVKANWTNEYDIEVGL